MRHLFLVAAIVIATPAAGQTGGSMLEAHCTDGKDLWVQLASNVPGALYVNLPYGKAVKVMDLPAQATVASVGLPETCDNMPGAAGDVCIVAKPQPAIVFVGAGRRQTYCPATITTFGIRPEVRR